MNHFKFLSKFTLLIILLTSLISCQQSKPDLSQVLPSTKINLLDNYYCNYFNVKEYSVDVQEYDSSFNDYPTIEYFKDRYVGRFSQWSKYSNIDTVEWNRISYTLSLCDKKNVLENIESEERGIYYAGSYFLIGPRQAIRKKYYYQLLFLDLDNGKLYTFRNIKY